MGSGDRVGVAEGILVNADDFFCVLQLDGFSLNKSENLSLYLTLQPVKGVCYSNSGGWEASWITEEFKVELGNEPLKGVLVAFINSRIGDLISLTVVGHISRSKLICNMSGRSQLSILVVDT